MHRHYIDSCEHSLYPSFYELYQTSFPIFEQRTKAQQVEAFENNQYRLLCFTKENSLLGFIGYWEFDTYIYVEHFAIHTQLRGKGYGSQLLKDFIDSTQKIVLLEIDPIVDSVSKARLRFYSRCGFFANPYSHTHPAYRSEYQPHSLVVLTTKRTISEEEYQRFNSDLKAAVMLGRV